MLDYAAHPERVTKELNDMAETDREVAISLAVAASMGIDPAVWLRDACIDALGLIGEKSPTSVDVAVALLENLSKQAPSPYTMKKATRAIERIRGKT